MIRKIFADRKKIVNKYIIIIFYVNMLCTLFASNWYIDNVAKGKGNGTSWQDAWTGFSNIVWDKIKPGDFVYISGGQKSKIYKERLRIGISGDEINGYITFSVSQEKGHNGKVIITESELSGIRVNKAKYVKITGQVGNSPECHILLTKNKMGGLIIDGDSHHFEICYIEITDNISEKELERKGNGLKAYLKTDQPYYGEIHHLKIHNNQVQVEVSIGADNPDSIHFGSLKIHHNDVFNFHGDAYQIGMNSMDFYNNKIHDRGEYYPPAHCDGIQIWGRHHRIYNNHFFNFIDETGDGNANAYIRYNPDRVDTGFFYIYNNLFTETNIPTDDFFFRGIELSAHAYRNARSCHQMYVFNNVFKGIPFFALFMGFTNIKPENLSEIRIENNVFIDNGAMNPKNTPQLSFVTESGTTFGSHNDKVDIIVDYNCFFASSNLYSTKNAINDTVYSYADFKSELGCEKNGLFIDPKLNSLFLPASSSPLIGKGGNLSAFPITIEQGSDWNIGAY